MMDGWNSHFGIKPLINEGFDYFRITFPLNQAFDDSRIRGVEKGVVSKKIEKSEKQKIILELMINKPGISKTEIQNTTGLGKKAIDYNIELLKKNGIIKRVGPARGGYWKVLLGD
jgi:ATP-dependent DNA helicase RecG